MATKEDQETLRLLVQHVSRAFYEPKYTIIMDQLARHPVELFFLSLKDDDLAGRMGLQPKELNKVIAVLSNDSLVKIHRQNELKEGAQRSVGKQYYYIDYEHFCNVVKWRIAKMRHIIDSTLRNELDNKGYICTQCKQAYTPLEVDRLMDFAQGTLICEICHAEVIDNENAESVQGSKDRMQRFNNQMRFIREGLQKSESMVLPAFDAEQWIKTHPSESDKQRAAGTASAAGGGLKVAGSAGGTVDQGIGILMALDKDETQRKMERDAQAEAKRMQNALPSWHLKSTITGDLTALGIREKGRAEAAAAVNSSNDDALKGLGIIGGSSQKTHNNQLNGTSGRSNSQATEDVKPTINVEADLYDQYYASLAASTAVTPTGYTYSAGGSHSDSPVGDDITFSNGTRFEEEDKKPNIDYLDSLNAYRKRSRSQEDVGGEGKEKVAKLNGTNGVANGHANGFAAPVVANGSPVDQEMWSASQDMSVDGGGSADDPMVMVNGTPKPYSQVTEEDHELMTPEEYTAYFEIMQTMS
ncbi:hypothetical protein CVT24_000784 [Panaeolus cyanescens]|uniref:HTH TFE/IIEalpha-type domain-containing protein n=1 Tax=Panaeolus cyanescens TaxID=181874 RepID=A0A409YCN1_9AGAR|nr:hypothetical protein CVT24_000784 [Panaeolus cyanescens]